MKASLVELSERNAKEFNAGCIRTGKARAQLGLTEEAIDGDLAGEPFFMCISR